MSTIQKAEELLSLMTKGEKTQLLQRVARDLGDASPGIDVTPGVCGGTPCIVRTRMPVWVASASQTPEKYRSRHVQCYPTLRAEDLANAWAYF